MKITFRIQVNLEAEIRVGQKLGFTGVSGSDSISATANANGWTPLNAVRVAYRWELELIRAAADQCNARREVAIVSEVTPTLLLVPQMVKHATYKRTVEGYAIDLLMAAKHLNLKHLHFTHFGFLQSMKATSDFQKILEVFLNPLAESGLEELIWDIDYRGFRILLNAYDAVSARFHLPYVQPTTELAPQFTWGRPIATSGGYSWHELVPSAPTQPSMPMF